MLPSISGSDEHRMVGFSERAIDNDGFPALDVLSLLVRMQKELIIVYSIQQICDGASNWVLFR